MFDIKKIFILSFICSFLPLAAQESKKFNVEYNELKGELTNNDLSKKEFGRYDGLNLPLYEGERLNINLYSQDFSGKLILVNPKGEVYKQSMPNSNGIASIIADIPGSGDWIVYIVGDEASTGKYLLQYGMAAPNSLKYNLETDFCTAISFITEHANANFLLIENFKSDAEVIPRLPGSIDTYLDEEEPVYISVFYSGNDLNEAATLLHKLTTDIEICLEKKFLKSRIVNNSSELKKMEISIKEETSSKKIICLLLEQKDNNYLGGKYQVIIKIYKS